MKDHLLNSIFETYDSLEKSYKSSKTNLNEVSMIPPLDNMPKKINHPFGEKRSYEIHPGVDLGVPSGSEVKAPMDGVVKKATCCGPKCGGTIDIDYGNGFWSRFCHIKRIDVKEGDVVKQGQVVGLSGGASGDYGKGNSKGAHLHFTLKKDGKLVDPMDYIGKTVEQGQIDVMQTNTDDEDESSSDSNFTEKVGKYLQDKTEVGKDVISALFGSYFTTKENREIMSAFDEIQSISKNTIIEADIRGIDELVYNPITGPNGKIGFGYDRGRKIPGIKWKNHYDHLHIGFTDKNVAMEVIDKADQLGLKTTENPYAKKDPTGKIENLHTSGSFHYKEFPGLPKVGGGVDISGNEDKMLELIQWIIEKYAGETPDINPDFETTTTDSESQLPVSSPTPIAGSSFSEKVDHYFEDKPEVGKDVISALFGSYFTTKENREIQTTKEDRKVNKILENIKRIKSLLK